LGDGRRFGRRLRRTARLFLDRLVPVWEQLLDAAAGAGEVWAEFEAHELMRGVDNRCVGADQDPCYDARQLVQLPIAGSSRPN
jgi:hypothetical protein